MVCIFRPHECRNHVRPEIGDPPDRAVSDLDSEIWSRTIKVSDGAR